MLFRELLRAQIYDLLHVVAEVRFVVVAKQLGDVVERHTLGDGLVLFKKAVEADNPDIGFDGASHLFVEDGLEASGADWTHTVMFVDRNFPALLME